MVMRYSRVMTAIKHETTLSIARGRLDNSRGRHAVGSSWRIRLAANCHDFDQPVRFFYFKKHTQWRNTKRTETFANCNPFVRWIDSEFPVDCVTRFRYLVSISPLYP